MKVYLLKDVEKIGLKGEVINAKEGYAKNFLIPRKIGVILTPGNQEFFLKKVKTVVHRKEAVESKSSMLAERIKLTTIVLKKKMHDDGKLYGAVNRSELVDLLAEKGIKVSKSQVIIEKSIKTKGEFKVQLRLSSKLKPEIVLRVVEGK